MATDSLDRSLATTRRAGERPSLTARYLLVSLVAAIVPLAATVVLYDRYAADLVLRLAGERVESSLTATSSKLADFLRSRAYQLEALADLPRLADVAHVEPHRLDARTLALLRFETDSPDVYAVVFFDEDGRVLAALPSQSAIAAPAWENERIDLDALPRAAFLGAELVGPVVPADGRPAWFLMRRRVAGSDVAVGLQVRLASLTELLWGGALEFYRPVLHTPAGRLFSMVGVEVPATAPLIRGPEIAAGWYPAMRREATALPTPSPPVRYLLIGLAALSAGVILALFWRLGVRIRRRITPLVAGAQAVARGELQVDIPAEGEDEIATLARAFNHMSAQLRSLIRARVETEKRAVLGEFAASVAHEVRNPLATIKTSVQALGARETEASRRELLGLIVEEIDRIDAVIESLLGFARPREPERSVVAAKDLLRRVTALVASMAEESRVGLSVTGEPALRFYLDVGQAQQILMNLVLNALQAMPKGGTLTLRAYRDGEFGCIAVTDTGCGIPPEALDRVAEPFFTTKAGGTGLGLPVSRQLAEMNGGTLEISSAPGAGTTVLVRLPLAAEPEHEDLAAGADHR